MPAIAIRNAGRTGRRSAKMQSFSREGSSFDGDGRQYERSEVVLLSGPPGSAARRRKRDLGYRTGAEMSRNKLRRFFRHGLLPQLFAFDAVARLGSVTRAAEELHLAQPTVSLQLKKLSESLGVPLIEFRGRTLRLTAAGTILQDLCAELDRE